MSSRPLEDITLEFEFREIHDAIRRLTWMLQDEAKTRSERIEETARAGYDALQSLQYKHKSVKSELERTRSDLARAVAVMG